LQLAIIWDQLPQFALGLWNTVWLCLVSMVASVILGILFMIPIMSRRCWIRITTQLIIDAGRSVPFLLLIYLVYFALPAIGIALDKWTTAIVSLILYNTAYIAEILRAGWAHLPQEQTEAGRAFGLTGFRLFRRIILPQVLIAVGPVLGNQLIQLIKDSAFLSIITVPELTFAANFVQSYYFVPFISFLFATLLYWGLCSGVELLVRQGERLSARVRIGHG
jgi:polar amino acid transport system permease protein